MSLINSNLQNLIHQARAASEASASTPRGVEWGDQGEQPAQNHSVPFLNGLINPWNLHPLLPGQQAWMQAFHGLQFKVLMEYFMTQYGASRNPIIPPIAQTRSEHQREDLGGQLLPDPNVSTELVPAPEAPLEPVVQDEEMSIVVGQRRARRKCPGSLVFYLVNEQNEIVVDEKTKKPTAICFKCRKAFGDENSIYRHMKIHDKTSRHQCPLCPGIHVQRYNLRIHMETHIGMDVSQEIMDTLPSEFRGVLEGDPDIIAPEKYRKKLVRALRKRIKTANCHEVVQNLQTKLLSLEHGIA
ncbi:hypothetical protein TCAL_16771 [Tigriopus californicus]|uniref:C2H2-type domain-containing protein n=1 Tax=Tigriopus californicus TaxID=6832 RepID=A0A553PTY6_TIGCA|nr:uncharacterized protein LOC131891659 [Tigriopus californicus]TRY81145.1 hypothetical protein TCAL_16771 [Tigriopus californicus]